MSSSRALQSGTSACSALGCCSCNCNPSKERQDLHPAGTAPSPVNQPCTPTAPAAAGPSSTASITGVPALAPPARRYTHHTGTAFYCSGEKFYCEQRFIYFVRGNRVALSSCSGCKTTVEFIQINSFLTSGKHNFHSCLNSSLN